MHYGILLLGMILPVIIVIAYPNFYHHSDVKTFTRWAYAWHMGWREIYNTCSGCNYPILGTISTAYMFKILFRIGVDNPILVFRLLLAVVDGVNVLLIFFLMKKLSIKSAALWAGITGLLLSSWAGGAVWGQIDGISQFFILLTLVWIVLFNISKRINWTVYLIGSSLLLACLLLMKQLTVFSFVPLELILMANIFSGRRWLPAAGYWLAHLVLLSIFVFSWDLPLNIEDPYLSHLALIWGARSESVGALSMNGFSIWIFLDRDMMSSSAIPLFSQPWAAWLTPQNIGTALFLMLSIVIFLSTMLYWRRRTALRVGGLDREDLFNGFLVLAFVNLAFNVVLTGTHERYLFHCYPFLLLACLGLSEFDKRFANALKAFVIAGAVLYGWFVLRILQGNIANVYSVHKYVAIFHLVLLVVFFLITLGYHEFGKRIEGLLTGRPWPVRHG